MNKIIFPRIGVNGDIKTKKDIEDWFYNNFHQEIKDRIDDKFNNIDFALTKTEKRILLLIKISLKHLLLSPPSTLEIITKIIDNRLLSKNFKTCLLKAFNYKNYRKNKLLELAKILNVKTCPYCNMHYTLYVEGFKNQNKMRLAKFQFDHFYDKSRYPMLSMSLYNLIPSCSICNNGKSTTKLSLSFNPYYSDICKQFIFKVKYPINLFQGEVINDNIDLDIISTKQNKVHELTSFINTFNLKILYERHKDIVQEIFDKAYLYPYYSNPENFSFLEFSNFDQLWLGTYTEEENINKRPMTKFIQDIWEQANYNK